MEVLALMIPILSIVGFFVLIIYLRRYQNIERMAMIEKGVDPSHFRQPGDASGTLRAALLLIGVGLGFLLGYFLDRTFDMEEVGYFSMLFLCGGFGLAIAYIVEEKKAREQR